MSGEAGKTEAEDRQTDTRRESKERKTTQRGRTAGMRTHSVSRGRYYCANMIASLDPALYLHCSSRLYLCIL